jgi:membrane protein DedA with SNARE-associated domain
MIAGYGRWPRARSASPAPVLPGNVVRSNVPYGLMNAKTIVAAGVVAATIALVGGAAGSETAAAIRTTNQARELDTAIRSLPAGAERPQRRLFDLLARDGVWLLFAAQVFGIFGLPIPDELLLTFAGGLVRRGDLAGLPTFAAAVAGAMAGMTFNYTVGRLSVRVLGRLPAVENDTFNRAQSSFKRWGKWLLVFVCFVPGLRHITPLAAGSGKLDARTFCAYAYPGAALWSTTFIAIGYYAGAGHDWKHAALLLRGHHALVAMALGSVFSMYVLGSRWPRFQKRRRVG